jgi:predicted nucleic-acid-binding protein
MRSVDTNALVRMIARDDERQAAGADTFVTGGAWVSHLVLAETVWVLESVYERTHKQLETAVEMLLEHEHLSIQEPEVVATALARYQNRPRIGFSDCLILEIARKAGHTPLGTFDRNLSKLDGTKLISV